MFRSTPRRTLSKSSSVRRTIGAKPKETPIEELTYCLDRIEELVYSTNMFYYDRSSYAASSTTETPRKSLTGFRSRRKLLLERKELEKQDENQAKESKAKFIPMLPSEEEEMVELLRRVAELVVMGEKAAAKVQSGDPNSSETESHIALFEQFFERNSLELIVSIVTGASFSEPILPKVSMHSTYSDTVVDAIAEDDPDTPKGPTPEPFFPADEATTATEASEVGSVTSEAASPTKTKVTMLPPLQIATQAIQSVSILIQNVSRATSLYFLLSNNYINNLINLPLEMYNIAERFKRGETESILQRRHASPEMAELTTHYVTFLKSLALRMNAETLQFFLTYPTESGSEADGVVPSMTASSAHFSSNVGEDDDDDAMEGPMDEDTPMDERASQQQRRVQPISKPVTVKSVEVEFPLYARALEFCAAHQDSFVRVTAMNICLNTLRLATVCNESETMSANNHQSGASPDGSLGDQALPLRERLAIAQHVCAPNRVQGLVSPIFTKLAQLWGIIEEKIRDMDLLREGKTDLAFGGPRVKSSKSMEKAKMETKRKRYTDALRDSVADLQDELLLLEDVFRVGLTSLNEQIIEMMLATFVYPLLLQPLLLYMQRFTSPETEQSRRLSEHFMVDILALGASTMKPELEEEVELSRIQEAAPAKTALFTLAAVFQLLSNRPLMRLLLAALFHPMAPDSSGETMIRAKPDVACQLPGGKIGIRTDTFQTESSVPIEMEPSPYSFGNVTGEKRVKSEIIAAMDGGDGSCVYVLSPALTEVLEGQAGDVSLMAKTRANPYRRAILKCLCGGPGMSSIRQLSVLLFDAVVQRFESKFVSGLIFGAALKRIGDDVPMDERNLDSREAFFANNRGMGAKNHRDSRHSLGGTGREGNFMSEVVSALCCGVINVSTNYDGLWKVVFDGVAAHSLLWMSKDNHKAMDLASKVMEQRRRMASSFVAEMPLVMDTILDMIDKKSSDETDDASHDGTDTRIGLHVDKMFYDVPQNKQYSVVGELLKLKDTVGKTDMDEYAVSVAVRSKFDDLQERLCAIGRLALSDDVKAAIHQIGAGSGMAYVQVDAFSTFLKELAATNSAALHGQKAFAITRNGTIVSTRLASGIDVNRSIFAPVSPKVCTNLLRLDEDLGDRDAPKPGSVVGLVGRTAIPCVCEVPECSAPLFTDDAASVISDGVTWQSLYLVFLGRFMILAEPERGGSGGNGRIVTACQLNMLAVERDPLPPTGNASPARRLLAVHTSIEDTPPGLFQNEGPQKKITPFGPFNRLHYNKSSLDLWFEDLNAAEHAFRIMQAKLNRARSKRGLRLREKLQEDL